MNEARFSVVRGILERAGYCLGRITTLRNRVSSPSPFPCIMAR